MTTAWVRASPVAAGLAAARSRLPAGALELACHAAVAVAVDAGLLHLLRINFFLDPPTVLPFEAEAALLLSPLFREVGEDLYEIDPALRDALLAALTARFGPERPARVAVLLEQYTDQHPAWHLQPELEHAQRLTALNLVDPARAADWLAANRPSAGGPALTREWFVAMTGRLRPRTSLPDRLADAVAAADAPSHELRAAAVAELGELALLPGADVRAIALRLERVARVDDPPLRDIARDVLDTVKRLVPPPAPRQPAGDEPSDPYRSVPFPALYGIDPSTFDPERAWAVPGNLTVPIGTDPDGRPVLLDLREPGHGGTGPHALIVGATGAGKSELLRTLIVGLAARHSPAELNILPVDLRGGAAFAGLETLPHLAGLAVDSGDLVSLIERFKDVVLGEISRRQQPFTARRPHLLIVVDEFGSLLTADPSLIDTLISIGRLGRPVGIHLVVACQRLESGHLRGLDAHLSVRIALRAFSEQESQLAIGTPEAFDLPRAAGHGFLRAGDGAPQRFRGTSVSDPYSASWDDVLAQRPDSLLDVLVRRMAGHGAEVHQVWLPPLPPVLALGDLPADGVTIGEVDVPREHRRRPFSIDLSGASGHVAIVGEPRTGKTTALRTVVAALARTARPVGVYCVGGDLGPLIGLPDVITVLDPAHDHDTLNALFGSLGGSTAADTVLVVDGWSNLLRRYPGLGDLVSAGRVVIVASDERWSRFSEEHLAAFGTRVELRLDHPDTSRISVPAARLLRYETAGRALTAGGLQMQIALPIRRGGGSHEAYLRELATTPVEQPRPRIRLGTFLSGGEEFAVDFAADPHLIVLDASPDERLAVRQAIERSGNGEIVGPDDTTRVVEELQRSSGGVRMTGPDLWVIAEGALTPLTALRDLLPYASGLRLRVVVFAPVGASDGIVRTLKDLATPTITLSREIGELAVPDQQPRQIRLDPPTSPGVRFAELHGIDPATFDPARAWAVPGNLAVPIGSDPEGRAILVDLRDGSEGGMGPHGLVVGAAGAGTSELLRSLVLGLAVTNSPAELNILAVDFGGATFAGLEALPHLAGIVVDDVPRLVHVLLGEVDRRQQADPGRRPRLLVVIDEFGSSSPRSRRPSTRSSRCSGSAVPSASMSCWPPGSWPRTGSAGWTRT
ncbi:FtsK/SpoIIIE domain-containing protein [Dactylosporangium cerinum]